LLGPLWLNLPNPALEKCDLLDDPKLVTYIVVMKPTEFKLPENEVETEAEQHAEETRRAVSAASKNQQPMRKKLPAQGKGRRK
jgi:hypothetical protein